MNTKYVIMSNGAFAIFSVYLGREHVEVAKFLGDKVIAAGFCRADGEAIGCYGRSLSTGVDSRGAIDDDFFAKEMPTALLMLWDSPHTCGWIVTNRPDAFAHDYPPTVATMTEMIGRKVIC